LTTPPAPREAAGRPEMGRLGSPGSGGCIMTVGVGVIGAGVMGADHARFLATSVAGAALVAVSDPDATRRNAVADAWGVAVRHAEAEALIADDNVEAVVIASPDPTHKAYTLAALAAGKPVLCEKPLATSVADCLDIVAHETAIGRRMIQVGFMRRFDPGYAAMKQALADDRLGAALMLHCIHRNMQAAPYTTSEGLNANSAVHEIDIARWLLGDEVSRALVVTPRASGLAAIRDPQILILTMTGGAVIDAEIFVNAQYGYDVRAELVCERGTVSLLPPSATLIREERREGILHGPDWRGRFADAYRIELQAWIDSLRSGKPAVHGASAYDGYAATAIAEAALKSLGSGLPVDVRLEPRPPLYGTGSG